MVHRTFRDLNGYPTSVGVKLLMSVVRRGEGDRTGEGWVRGDRSMKLNVPANPPQLVAAPLCQTQDKNGGPGPCPQ